jgi:hypothetical protein
MEELYITKKQVEKAVEISLAEILSKKGFTYMKTKGNFIRKTSYGFDEIYTAITNFWPLKQDFGIGMSLRISEFEVLFAKFFDHRFGNFTKSNVANRTTTHQKITLTNILETGQRELYTSKDINLCCQELIQFFNNEEVFSFFDEFSKIENVCKKMKEDFNLAIEKKRAISCGGSIRFFIILKLANDIEYEYYKELIISLIKSQKLNKEIQETPIEQEQALYDCIEYLDK